MAGLLRSRAVALNWSNGEDLQTLAIVDIDSQEYGRRSLKQRSNRATSMSDPSGARDRNESKTARSHPQLQARKPPARFKVSELLSGAREAVLEHEGQEYRLRITANRKLILTK